MAAMRWDPFVGFDRMLELMGGRVEGSRQRSMPMDIFRRGDEYVVEMELPGVDPQSIEVQAERNSLTVTAESRSNHAGADEEVLCERNHATFVRQLYLGENLDTDRIEANYDNGILSLRVPRAEREQSRRIEVKANAAPQAIEAQRVGSEAGNGGQKVNA